MSADEVGLPLFTIVLGIGVATLSQHRLQEKAGRILKLTAGVVMLGLGGYLLVPH